MGYQYYTSTIPIIIFLWVMKIFIHIFKRVTPTKRGKFYILIATLYLVTLRIGVYDIPGQNGGRSRFTRSNCNRLPFWTGLTLSPTRCTQKGHTITKPTKNGCAILGAAKKLLWLAHFERHLVLNGLVHEKQWCSSQICISTLSEIRNGTLPKLRRLSSFDRPPLWPGML